MKKFLSLFLAVLMVLSLATTIVVSAGAEEAAGSAIDVSLDGLWTECEFKESFKDKANVRYRGFWSAGSKHGAGGFMFSYGEGNKATPVDISAMEYIEFDVYVSDVNAMADVLFSFELTSGGTADQQEVAKKFTGKDTGWVNGWNHVKWALTDFTEKTGGEFNPTAWNYIRWYNDTDLTIGEYLEVAIANLQFVGPAREAIEVSVEGPWSASVIKENFQDVAKVQYRGFAAGSTHGAGGFMFCYGEGGKATPVDISAMSHIEFDVFVSNIDDLANVEFSFELTSKGTADQEEIAKKFTGATSGWQNGWNHVKWELADFTAKTGGEFNATAWNYIRWYNDSTLNVGAEKLTVAIVNIAFTNGIDAPATPEEPETPETPDEPETPEITVVEGFKELGDAFLADFNQYGNVEATKENFQGDSSAPVKVALANAEMLAKWNWLWVYMLDHLKATNPDATSAYLTDAYPVLEKMIAGDTTAILDNANARTSIRSYIHGFLNSMKGCGEINTDFSKFSPDFSSAEEQEKLVEASKAAETPAEPDDGSIKIPLDGPWDQCWPEAIEGVDTQTRIYYNKPGPHGAGGFMFRYNEGGNKAEAVDISGMSYLEFDIYISEVSIIADVEFSFELTSSGTSDKEESAKKFKGKDTGWVNGWNHVKWGLDEFTAKNGEFDPTRWNFIRWYNDTSLNATDWFQVGITNIKFTPKSAADLDAEEATATEHSIPLWGCNTTWDVAPESWVVDKENQVAGSGCITVNLKNRVDVMAPEKHFETPINATGMDTLEFDIYLSDLAIVEYFSDTDGALELTSSGTSDSAEVAYNLRNFTKYVLADAQVGWNHVSIKIKNMEVNEGAKGPFDISAINFIRFYWVHPKACDQDWILKLDNFRLTDAAAQEEAKKEEEAQKVLEKLADLLAEIDALQSIADATVTAENYDALKAQYEGVKAKYVALTEEEQTILSDKGYARKLSDAYKPLEKYEEVLAKAEALKDIIAAMEALAPYKDAAAFTHENYETVKKQIADTRKAYEDLVRSDKKFLEDNGYLAHLEAAEAALPAEAPKAPECTEHVDADNNGKCDNCDAEVEKKPDEPNKPDEPSTPGDDKPTEEPKEEGGCKSALTIGALATMILAGAWVTIAARKKDN